MKKKVHLGIFGLGTVGTGVVELLLKRKQMVGDCQVVLEKVAVRHKRKKRAVSLPSSLLTTSPEDILRDPKIDTVIEVMGGVNPAREIILEALRRRKNVVTANKALLARAGSEIFKEAMENDCYLGVRASNIASYRLIESLSFSPSRISKLVGVFNGTCNYILTEMERKEEDFSTVLGRAQKMGYTERDPSDDVDGYDTAHKLIVLLGLSLGYFPPLGSILVEGIRNISPLDVIFARELGYRIKLLAIAKIQGNDLEARVHPALLPRDRGLARLEGIENGIELRDEVGLEIGMQAPGAGKYPTATAILEDLICVARGRKLAFPSDKKKLSLRGMGRIETQYYLRLSALDEAGVLGKISCVLGEHGISIKSVLQKGRDEKKRKSVPLIMLTHEAREENLQKALKRMEKLPVVKEKPVLMRVEEGIF
ncbi:MAG: homoserine dehydrogenase [Candidatus Aerophobetes bacterium]